jgi:hypothetical protein
MHLFISALEDVSNTVISTNFLISDIPPQVYTNSFLATLNARKTITGRIDDVSHMLVSMPPTLITPLGSAGKVSKVSQNISIRIDTTKERDRLDVVCALLP